MTRRRRLDLQPAHAIACSGSLVPPSCPAIADPLPPSTMTFNAASRCQTLQPCLPTCQPPLNPTLTFHCRPQPPLTSPTPLLNFHTLLHHLLTLHGPQARASRPLLLASLTTSTTNRQLPTSRQQQQPPQQLRACSHLPPLVNTLQGLPVEFMAAQSQAEHIYNFHMASSGTFPRPCPHCSSAEFLLPLEEQERRAAAGTGAGEASSSPGTSLPTSVSSPSPSGAAPARWFQSRPLVCEQCQRWFHMGCLGIQYVEDVPCRPWFHCRGCRESFIKMEALRRRGEILLPTSEAGLVTIAFATPADLSALLAGVGARLTRARGGPDPDAGAAGGSRALLLPVLDLLGSSGLGAAVVQRLMEPGAEYDAGRYAMLLRKDEEALGAASFNVFGPDLPAQVGLVAAKPGFQPLLLDLLETALGEELGVNCMLAQPQPGLSQALAAQLGYRPLHPRDVAELHMAMPVAFLDAPVLGKEL